MKFCIDEKICKKHNLTVEELLVALTMRQVESPREVTQNLLGKEVLVFRDGQYYVTQRWSNEIDEIIADSTNTVDETRLIELAEKMKELYPKGRTPDGKYVYRGNRKENIQHLKRFFMMYGDYPDEDILDATKRYVEHFKEDYHDMRQLKYFIIKDLTKEGKGIISDLATFLENNEEEDEANTNSYTDWRARMA